MELLLPYWSSSSFFTWCCNPPLGRSSSLYIYTYLLSYQHRSSIPSPIHRTLSTPLGGRNKLPNTLAITSTHSTFIHQGQKAKPSCLNTFGVGNIPVPFWRVHLRGRLLSTSFKCYQIAPVTQWNEDLFEAASLQIEVAGVIFAILWPILWHGRVFVYRFLTFTS